MIRILCVCTFLLAASFDLFAAETGKKISTNFEIRQDLFSQVNQSFPAASNLQTETPFKRKSPALAALYSLLIPGLGEYYAEGFGSGKYFLIAEGALWLTYTTFDIYGSSQRDDARAYAASHAGIKPEGKSDEYFIDIGNFASTSEFNEKRLREHNLDRLYNDVAYFWNWDSDASRQQFKDIRNSGENALNNRKFVVSAIIINHIASAINAARSAISYNKNLSNSTGELQFKADVLGGYANPNGIMLTVVKNF